MMVCDYCGNVLSDKWKYCPYCGRKIKGEADERDLFSSLFRDGITGFSIRITSVEGEKPKVRVNQFGPVKVPIKWVEEENSAEEDSAEEEEESPLFIPQKVLEPEGMVQQIGQHTLIRVRLPGVKEDNISVRKLAESVEIKAYKNDEAYFKQFQVPHTARIISKYMDGDELIVEVG
ncbi:MAG: zinc ribbon domain-containing protein [Theionarchaea archaeon]|nr:zinc ribbon domain-containing protein [Theionarchaea archaeon]